MSISNSVNVKQKSNCPVFVSPVQDREVIVLGDAYASFAGMTVDTDNVGDSDTHILGTKSVTFDKTAAGGGTVVYAGVEITSLAIDMSRLIASDRIDVCCYFSSIADIISVSLYLGDDATNYNGWNVLVASLVAGWNNVSFPIAEGLTATGTTGWDMSDIAYAALVVEFSAVGDTLAGMLLNAIVAKSIRV